MSLESEHKPARIARGARAPWFITPHAVASFREYVPDTASLDHDEVVARIIEEARRTHFVKRLDTGALLYRGPRPAQLRYVVSEQSEGTLPALVTIKPSHDGSYTRGAVAVYQTGDVESTCACSECGEAFVPLMSRQVTCGAKECQNARENRTIRERRGIEALPPHTCPFCGTTVVARRHGQKTCGAARCRDMLRAYDPRRIAAARARNRAWAEAHRGVKTSNPWLHGPPVIGSHLPGGALTISSRDLGRKIEHGQIRALHGMMSEIIDRPHEQSPAWALYPPDQGGALDYSVGWVVYIYDREVAARLANRSFAANLLNRPATFTFGPLWKMRAPTVTKRGRGRIRVEAITPVSVRATQTDDDGQQTNVKVFRTVPTDDVIRHVLRQTAHRIGLDLPLDEIRATIVSHDTQPATVHLGGKFKVPERGWVGGLIVEANAVARWLLHAAARGPGLGSRTAFGFGRVRVTDMS